MEQFLSSPLAKALGGVIILLAIVKMVAAMMAKPQAEKFSVKVTCKSCGWTGQVGKYNRRCSSCNGTDLKSAG